MKQLFGLIIIFLLAHQFVRAEVLKALEENWQAPVLITDHSHFCVYDRKSSKIFIYSKDDYQKISEFGGKGEGPSEFMSISKISLYEDEVFVSHYPKLSVFSKKGKLKKILKGPTDSGSFIPFKDGFIGVRYFSSNADMKHSIIAFSLYNWDLSLEKDIFKDSVKKFNWHHSGKQNVLYLRDCFKVVPYKERIYIGFSEKGFFFSVFDLNGNKLYDIRREYEKKEVTGKYISTRKDQMKRMMGKRWEVYNARVKMIFPESFPAFSNFAVDNRKIYVFMHPTDKPEQEVQILDLKGVLLRRVTLSIIGGGITQANTVCIDNGRILYLKDNNETEKWEIRYEKL